MVSPPCRGGGARVLMTQWAMAVSQAGRAEDERPD